ncbi:bifunctional metallophosphatase/5'-nucleotidase [Pseudoroseomonas rhizosphaerae]|uniref:Bifunctional metallophosphatase/5'-nucleotidase n=1 Tax=Teichococcus rhizosphaerae TaxID=1335062 RepID=A0A2C7AD76_9PROT|nr:5'-nucleotidase C-terminal domain-containing protein [Pseudoroseomonas rhizosphaerae]PHK95034.1 bifunctional metallophosphatase/5'-nucleotidase [Pseudoroseomonas rhizosphaerae]
MPKDLTPPLGLARRALLRAAPLGLALALPALRRPRAEAAARLDLLHLNDFHARHDGSRPSGAACGPAGECLGGSARLATALREARGEAAAQGRAVLQLDAGDQFTGSLYHVAHHGLAEAAVQKATGCAAMALGNHEFDRGPEGLLRYAGAVDFPLLSANLDARRVPALQARIRPHATFRRGAARIGVIGLTTEDTPRSSSPGPDLAFTSAQEAAARQVAALRAEGFSTIVVLSHLGLAEDRALAAAVAGIDVIVGGHSHTLLADGLPGAAGPHPLLADGPDRPVRIVQAGAHGRWLGRLSLDLAADGRVLAHGGAVRPVTAALAEDGAVKALLAGFAAPLEALRASPAGPGAPGLTPEGCRGGECALGNLVADAMLAAEPEAEVALTNGGGLRAALPEGMITRGAVLDTLPYGNTLALVVLRGADLRAALEIGLSRAGVGGGFPQVAGMALRWRPGAPVGERVAAVTVGGRPLEPERAYRVVTNDFLRRGGDGYLPLRDRALAARDNGLPMDEALAVHIAAGGAARAAPRGRIRAE